MAKITLRIEADASAVSTALANLKKEVQSLSGLKIDLGIDANTASSIAKAAKAMADLEKAQAQSAKANAQVQAQVQKTIQAHEETAQAMEKTAQAQEKTSQSANHLAEARERTYQAEERTTQAFERSYQMQERTAQGATNLAIAQEKTEQSANRLATEQERTARATLQSGEAAQTANGAFSALSVALGNIAARAFHMVISKITQGIREALTTMKDVDTQLTNISKVSGITGKALSDMGERAYETASKYGVAADEYLSAVYTFQKAGLGESAEAMGELAVKTMLVGDTTADVASQFLISANAAWKFGGNIEDLNRIVDEADYINNNYATDLTKLSQGLPRVASVAAQAGMSAEETLAAIGTITAVTQESGTKAATALRALILNIEGQVGEFVDDTGESFTVTEESVKSMQGLMEKYAKAELDAARASGELINPMTAIKAIFEGMANSDLNDQELFTLLSGMGGKLRTNQLTALVQNYELFDDMLNKIADSAGTADGEISLMMESWERKTQVLKNTWTEFIADFVDTDTIKGSIDVLTEAISGLDDLLFKTGSERTKSKYTDLKAEYDALLAKGAALTAQEEKRLKWIEKQTEALNKQAAAQANLEARNSGRRQVGTNPDGTPLYYEDAMYESLSAGWQNAGRQLSEGSISAEEYLSRMREVVSANQDYYDSLIQWKDLGADLSDSQNNFIRDFEYAENVIKATSVDLQDAGDGYQYIVDQQGNAIAKIKAYDEAQNQATTATEDLADLWGNMTQPVEDVVKAHNQWSDSLDEESLNTHTAFDDLVSGTESVIQGLTEMGAGAAEAASETGDISAAAAGIDFDPAVAAAQALARALAAADAAASGISIPVGAGFDSEASGTYSAPGGKTLVNELGPELISDNGKAYIANGGKPAVVNLSKGAIVLPANVTRDAMKGGIPTYAAVGGILGDPDYGGGAAGEAQAARQRAIDEAYRARRGDRIADRDAPPVGTPNKPWTCPSCGTTVAAGVSKCPVCGYQKPNSSGGGKKSGGGKSAKQRAEDAAKKLASQLSSIDKRASLADKEKRYDDEKSLYKRAISLIKKQLQRYKKAGFSDKSDAVVDLKSKLHDYEDKLANVNKTQWDAEIDAREQALREQRAQDQMAEKEAAVEKARQALENAQKQRNVRIFNAATGQWEWVADQGAVQRAQEQYDSAQRTLTQAQEDAELDALRKRRDAGEKYPGSGSDSTQLVGRSLDVETVNGKRTRGYAGQQGALFGGAPSETTSGIYRNSSATDSHDTVYNFGNITLSEAEAQSTSVAELAKKLNVLKIS
jgi:TP901 family phage tail tape measure protein